MHGRMCGLPVLVLVVACSGCEVGRTMFQMDSNSQSPFFGVDLLPSRRSASVVPPKLQESDLRDGPGQGRTLTVSESEPAPAPRTAAVATSPRREPSLLEKLKLSRGPDHIPLTLSEPSDEPALGPLPAFR
ncbi:MAG: hypothetical protein KF774_12130 [Planctomyces sp.]|nr:hypothetical protein [Planctomyces sp.]